MSDTRLHLHLYDVSDPSTIYFLFPRTSTSISEFSRLSRTTESEYATKSDCYNLCFYEVMRYHSASVPRSNPATSDVLYQSRQCLPSRQQRRAAKLMQIAGYGFRPDGVGVCFALLCYTLHEHLLWSSHTVVRDNRQWVDFGRVQRLRFGFVRLSCHHLQPSVAVMMVQMR